MSSVITSASLEPRPSRSGVHDVLLEFRERRAIEALERAAAKRQECAEQCAAENSAELRIPHEQQLRTAGRTSVRRSLCKVILQSRRFVVPF